MKTNPILLILILAFSPALFSADTGNAARDAGRAEKDSFYSKVKAARGFSDVDLKAARNAGYGSFLTYVLLEISAESGKPISGIMEMRAKGYSPGEIAASCGVDYSKVIEKVEETVRSNNIIFPPSDEDESRHDASSAPRSGKGVTK